MNVHSGGIKLSTGFNVQDSKPIDSNRFAVTTFNDLLGVAAIPTEYLYQWISVVTNDTGFRWKWNGQDRSQAQNWILDSSSNPSTGSSTERIHFETPLYIPSNPYLTTITSTYLKDNVTNVVFVGYKVGSDPVYCKLVHSTDNTKSTSNLEVTTTSLGVNQHTISYEASLCYVSCLNTGSDLYIKEILFW